MKERLKKFYQDHDNVVVIVTSGVHYKRCKYGENKRPC